MEVILEEYRNTSEKSKEKKSMLESCTIYNGNHSYKRQKCV